MAAQIALLRAVNVAGHGTVTMSALKAAFAAAGARDVRSYIQSGNILFTTPAGSAAELHRRIRGRLAALLGKDAVVLFRSRRQLEAVARAAPFGGLEGRPDRKLFISFLARRPRRPPRLPLRSEKEAVEAVGIRPREVYLATWRKRTGMFGFPNRLVEEEFGVPATSRSWNTVQRLVALCAENPPR